MRISGLDSLVLVVTASFFWFGLVLALDAIGYGMEWLMYSSVVAGLHGSTVQHRYCTGQSS